MEEEIWKDIVGYEGYYILSNRGEVVGLERTIVGKDGVVKIYKRKKQKTFISTTGYVIVILCKNGVAKKKSIHRLLATAFIPNPHNKPEINHKNSIRSDNRLENLEWVTRSENVQHGYSFGFMKQKRKPFIEKETKINKIKRSVVQLSLDGVYVNEYESISSASKSNNLHSAGISNCCRNKSAFCGKYLWKYKNDYMLNN